MGNRLARTRRKNQIERRFFCVGRKKILSNAGFGLAPLDVEIIAFGAGYHFNGDPFDETITAYAAHLDVPLITKDAAMTSAGLIETYW